MALINCGINFVLTWFVNFFIVDVASQAATFAVTNTKLYAPVVTLLAEVNAKFLQQLKSGFKKVIINQTNIDKNHININQN